MRNSIKVYFDLDGTVYDLYNKPNWLDDLENEKPNVFTANRFMPDPVRFRKLIGDLLMLGVEFEVITWLSMQSSPEYEKVCSAEKTEWVKKYMPFVQKVTCLSYGIPKQNAITKRSGLMYLIDDNADVCKQWETKKQRVALNVNSVYTVLDALEQIRNEIEMELIEGI